MPLTIIDSYGIAMIALAFRTRQVVESSPPESNITAPGFIEVRFYKIEKLVPINYKKILHSNNLLLYQKTNMGCLQNK